MNLGPLGWRGDSNHDIIFFSLKLLCKKNMYNINYCASIVQKNFFFFMFNIILQMCRTWCRIEFIANIFCLPYEWAYWFFEIFLCSVYLYLYIEFKPKHQNNQHELNKSSKGWNFYYQCISSQIDKKIIHMLLIYYMFYTTKISVYKIHFLKFKKGVHKD